MDLEQFEDLGINVLQATKWMDRLHIHPDDLIDNSKFLKVRDIFQFLSKYENADYLITKLNRGFTQDLVQKTWEYVQKYQDKERHIEEGERIKKELELIKDIPDAQDKVLMLKEEQVRHQVDIRNIDKELSVYETSN